MDKPVEKVKVFYHANCMDGFVSMCLWRLVPIHWLDKDVEYIAMQYGDAVPDVTDCAVVMLDVTVKPDALDEIISKAKSVKVLDHHQSAIDDYTSAYSSGSFEGKPLQNINKCGCFATKPAVKLSFVDALNAKPKFHIGFNTNNSKSGCLMVYSELSDYYTPDEVQAGFDVLKRMWYIASRISDRDVWKFEFEDTRAVYETVAAFNFSFDAFSAWFHLSEEEFHKPIRENQIRVDMRLEQAALYATKAQILEVEGYKVPCVNVPANYSSEVGSILAKTAPFAMMYVVNSEVAFLSFRSNKETGVNVVPIAQAFGGGGHVNSAGAKVPVARLFALFDENTQKAKEV